jgi:caffeoyl-CoA O-methyltransferase
MPAQSNKKNSFTETLNENLVDYSQSMSESIPNILLELERETHQKVLKPRMISGPLQGRLLSLLSCLINPKIIVEIGTYTGYSTLCLAEGLSEIGVIHTIDCNEELIPVQEKFFNKSVYNKKIKRYLGEALTILPKLDGPYDLVFIDADKINYDFYFEEVLPKMKVGGLIISDNVLWSGKVLEKVGSKDINTIALQKYNEKFKNDPRVKTVLLPLRDGITLSWVR